MTSPSLSCKVLILCGGKGTRLRELGKSIPKALVELHGEPILHHKLKDSINQGFSNFIIATGYKGNMIADYCKNSHLEFEVEFSDSGDDAGMLRRIADAKEYFEENIIITYGDSIANIQWQQLLNYHRQKKGMVTLVSAPIQSPFGMITFDEENHVLSLEEKPILYYYIGTFVMQKEALKNISQEILDLPDGGGLIAFFKILLEKKQLYNYKHDGVEITFNTVEELNTAKATFLKFHTHFG